MVSFRDSSLQDKTFAFDSALCLQATDLEIIDKLYSILHFIATAYLDNSIIMVKIETLCIL